MVDLKCKRQDCKYNKFCNCTANVIHVSDETSCVAYEKSKTAKKHEPDRIPQSLVRHNTDVFCDADCLFACDCSCIANGITVITTDGKSTKSNTKSKEKSCPCCATYLAK